MHGWATLAPVMARLDTHRAVKQLQEAGVPEAQAEAHVQLLEEAGETATRDLVTRDHLDQQLAVLHKELYRVLALGMGGAVAIAAAAVAIAEAL